MSSWWYQISFNIAAMIKIQIAIIFYISYCIQIWYWKVCRMIWRWSKNTIYLFRFWWISMVTLDGNPRYHNQRMWYRIQSWNMMVFVMVDCCVYLFLNWVSRFWAMVPTISTYLNSKSDCFWTMELFEDIPHSPYDTQRCKNDIGPIIMCVCDCSRSLKFHSLQIVPG